MPLRRRLVASAIFGSLGPRRLPLLPSSSPQANLGIDDIAIICRRAHLGSYEVTALIGQGGMGEVSRWHSATESQSWTSVRRRKFRALGGPQVYKGAIRGRQNGNPG